MFTNHDERGRATARAGGFYPLWTEARAERLAAIKAGDEKEAIKASEREDRLCQAILTGSIHDVPDFAVHVVVALSREPANELSPELRTLLDTASGIAAILQPLVPYSPEKVRNDDAA